MEKWIFVILGVAIYLDKSCEGLFTVRKCCREDQHVGEDLQCVENVDVSKEIDFQDGDWPWWFPNKAEIISMETGTSVEFPNITDITLGAQQPCCASETAYIFTYMDEKFDFFDNGALRIYGSRTQNKDTIFPPLSYCVDRLYGQYSTEVEFIIQLCPCKTTVCVLKCCDAGMFMHIPSVDYKEINESSCVRDRDEIISPTFENDTAVLLRGSNLSLDEYLSQLGDAWHPEGMEKYFILNRFPHCNAGEEIAIVDLSKTAMYNFDDDGSILLSGYGKSDALKYCGETVLNQRFQQQSVYILRCQSKSYSRYYLKIRRILYGSISVIGAFFLILTLITYAMLSRDLTVNDKNLIAQTWSLLIGYLSLAAQQLLVSYIPHGICITLGFVIMYSFLASFFWLNVLCIDLAWAFSELRLIRNMMVWQNRRRFLQYSLYGWLSPAIIVLAAIIVDFTPGIPDSILKPEFIARCWFPNDSKAKFAYFYGPIAILLIANVVLFLYTAYKIRDAQRQASSLLQNNAAREKQRINLYLKLFCLMGLSWSLELVSWVAGGPDYYWYGTDMINLFRAVIIFIILCCKKEVWEEVRQKLKVPTPRGRDAPSPSVVTLTSNQQSDRRFSQIASSVF